MKLFSLWIFAALLLCVSATRRKRDLPPPCEPCGYILGYNTTGSSRASATSNKLSGSPFIGGCAGYIQTMYVYIGSVATLVLDRKFRLGVYSDSSGLPSTLIVQGTTAPTLIANSWNSVTIPNVNITPGVRYWFIYNTNGLLAGDNDYAETTASGTIVRSVTTPFGILPSTFPTSLATTSTGTASIYTNVICLPDPPSPFTIWSTGVDDASASQPLGYNDTHYTVMAPGINGSVSPMTVPPQSGWMPNTPISAWISADDFISGGYGENIYSYYTDFNLTLFNLSDIVIYVSVAASESIALYMDDDLLLGIDAGEAPWSYFTNFTLEGSEGLVPDGATVYQVDFNTGTNMFRVDVAGNTNTTALQMILVGYELNDGLKRSIIFSPS